MHSGGNSCLVSQERFSKDGNKSKSEAYIFYSYCFKFFALMNLSAILTHCLFPPFEYISQSGIVNSGEEDKFSPSSLFLFISFIAKVVGMLIKYIYHLLNICGMRFRHMFHLLFMPELCYCADVRNEDCLTRLPNNSSAFHFYNSFCILYWDRRVGLLLLQTNSISWRNIVSRNVHHDALCWALGMAKIQTWAVASLWHLLSYGIWTGNF